MLVQWYGAALSGENHRGSNLSQENESLNKVFTGKLALACFTQTTINSNSNSNHHLRHSSNEGHIDSLASGWFLLVKVLSFGSGDECLCLSTRVT